MSQLAASHHTEHSPSRSMGWFVVISLLLHLMVLLGMQREQEQILFPAAQTQTAALALHLRPPEPAVKAKPEQAKQPARKVSARSQSSKPRSVRAEHQPEPQKTNSETPAEKSEVITTEAHPDSTTRLENLRVTLQRELTHYFNYPILARRNGWQGEVVLAFRLNVDGTIINARVARSSGYGVLDRAALNALGKVKRINHTLQQVQDMQLPVIYRLQEG